MIIGFHLNNSTLKFELFLSLFLSIERLGLVQSRRFNGRIQFEMPATGSRRHFHLPDATRQWFRSIESATKSRDVCASTAVTCSIVCVASATVLFAAAIETCKFHTEHWDRDVHAAEFVAQTANHLHSSNYCNGNCDDQSPDSTIRIPANGIFTCIAHPAFHQWFGSTISLQSHRCGRSGTLSIDWRSTRSIQRIIATYLKPR